MDVLELARWQFGITTVYHLFFVPLTIGLSILVATMQTVAWRTGDPRWHQLTSSAHRSHSSYPPDPPPS